MNLLYFILVPFIRIPVEFNFRSNFIALADNAVFLLNVYVRKARNKGFIYIFLNYLHGLLAQKDMSCCNLSCLHLPNKNSMVERLPRMHNP